MRRSETRQFQSPYPLLSPSRLGFHYFPDTLHYTARDLQIWLPLLMRLKVGWLVLVSSSARAIPEEFIRGLIHQAITPLIQFPFSPSAPPDFKEVAPIIEAYIKWGCRYIQIFDRPNLKSTWGMSYWTHPDLTEAFVDAFLPWAQWIVKCGGNPILAPLYPGGDYWDTAFLQNVLIILERRHQYDIIDNLHLSAYAWTHDHPLEWGQGGPLAWPEARPYDQNAQAQDHRGFRIFEWYEAIAQAVLERSLPIHLYHAGLPCDPLSFSHRPNSSHPTELPATQEVFLSLYSTSLPSPNEYPPYLASCNFWLLAASADSPFDSQAWFQEGKPLTPILTQWLDPHSVHSDSKSSLETSDMLERMRRPIRHYVLLPPNWRVHPETISFLLTQIPAGDQPTFGSSLAEAMFAQRVTVVEPEQHLPEIFAQLKANGCEVQSVQLTPSSQFSE